MPSSNFLSQFALSSKDVEGTFTSKFLKLFAVFGVFKMLFKCCSLEKNSWVSSGSFLSFWFLRLFKNREMQGYFLLRNDGAVADFAHLWLLWVKSFSFVIISFCENVLVFSKMFHFKPKIFNFLHLAMFLHFLILDEWASEVLCCNRLSYS